MKIVLIHRVAFNWGKNHVGRVGSAVVFLWAIFFGLPGSGLLGVDTTRAATRSLNLYFTHTRESAVIAFKRNGKYLPGGLKKLNYILRDWRRNEPTKMDPRLFDIVWEIYRKSGSKKPIQVVSGYRSPKTNASMRRRGRKVALKSLHIRGQAFDFFLPDVSLEKLRSLGLKAHAGGVGYYRGSFIHIDTGNVRHWPRMSRRQLAKVFPRGRTLHIPTDGKPMAGYQYALAKYNKRGKSRDKVLIASNRADKDGKNKVSLLRRIFGGGADEEEDKAILRETAKKPVARTRVTKNTAAPAKNSNGALPGVRLTKRPATAIPQPEHKLPEADVVVASIAVTVPRVRPEKPRSADIVQLVEAAESEKSATIIAARFDPARPSIRPNLKIADSRFALAAVPELTTTQKVADMLARLPSGPLPADISQQPVSAMFVTGATTLREKPTMVALLGVSRSFSIDDIDGSPIQQAIGRAVVRPLPDAVAANNTDITNTLSAARQPNQNTQTVSHPQSANRIDLAFAALSSDGATIISKPVSRPHDGVDVIVANLRPVNMFGARQLAPVAQKTTREHSLAASDIATRRIAVGAVKFRLGQLDGATVTSWALSSSTRVGKIARLKAPRYLGVLGIAPVAILNDGFSDGQTTSRINRFSGQSIRRLAFAKFLTSQLTSGQVFLTDKY